METKKTETTPDNELADGETPEPEVLEWRVALLGSTGEYLSTPTRRFPPDRLEKATRYRDKMRKRGLRALLYGVSTVPDTEFPKVVPPPEEVTE